MMDKIKILLVDDHAIMREGIRSLLSSYDDIEIIGEASDGKEAYEKVAELSPDVIIMDIGMAGLDGLEATRRIHKNDKRVKILILTQHENREYLISAIKAGAAGYLPKKAMGADLIAAIHSIYRGDSFLYPSATTALIEDYLTHIDEEPFDLLTSREREVLKLIADGLTSRQIADKLFLSLKTVLGHRTRIMDKLDIHNKADLIKYAISKGLVAIDNIDLR